MSSRGPGRPRQTSHERIREVALRLFLEQGYAATSLDQVARAAGISRTTLFAYFPSKRDLIWQDADELVGLARDVLGRASGRLVDVIAEGILTPAHYGVAEHDAMAERWRVAHDDEELRAFWGLRVEELVELLVAEATARAPQADPVLVDHVTRALMAVASRCTAEWAALPRVEQSLRDHTAERLRPFVDALRPLLP